MSVLLVLLLGTAAAAQDAAAAGPCTPYPAAYLATIDAVQLYERAARLGGSATRAGSGMIRRRSADDPASCERIGPWAVRAADPGPEATAVELLPLTGRIVGNSRYPRDRDNGFLWAGRGLNMMLAAGVALRRGALSARLAPAVAFQQNRDFARVEAEPPIGSPFANPWHGPRIDMPSRFGDRAFWSASAGESYLRYGTGAVALGFGTESMWVGPGRRAALVLSDNAGGFPHVFFRTSRPVDVGIGRLEAEIFNGRPSESDYFDDDRDNDRRMLIGTTAVLEPDYLPGLYLGGTRAYHETLDGPGLHLDRFLTNLFDLPFVEQAGNAPGNALASLFARWVFPQSGFEVYGEWAREDYSFNLDGFVREPDHSQAYLLGFGKLLRHGDAWYLLWGELVHLGQPMTVRAGHPDAPFYQHAEVQQGHTHNGQVLGAWLGPGSDSQSLGMDIIHEGGLTGVVIERVRYDDDAYYLHWAARYGRGRHDVELSASFRRVLFLGPWVVTGEFSLTRRWDRGFVALAAGTAPTAESNVGLDVSVVWLPGDSP